MDGSLMYENRERIIPRRATGYHQDDDGNLRVVHNYDFEIAGDGQLYTTVEDLLRWDDYLHGTDKPAIHQSMLTEGTLNDGEPISTPTASPQVSIAACGPWGTAVTPGGS